MSADGRFVRKTPEELVRRDSSQPPRTSYIRTKGLASVETAIDSFLQTQDRVALTSYPSEAIKEALSSRLRTADVETLVPLGTWMIDATVAGLRSDTIGLQRAALKFASLAPRSEYVRPLIEIALDAGGPLRSHARDALPAYEGMLQSACAWLRAILADVESTQQRRRRSMSLLALLGDARSLLLLIDYLGDCDRSVARAAHDALRQLTCHDLGTMRSAWQRWAEKSQHRTREDWLIEALMDRRPELRDCALQTLTRVTGHSFGVEPGAPRSAFMAVQEQYAALRLNAPSGLRALSMPPSQYPLALDE